MSEHELIARVCEAVQGYLVLGNEAIEAHDALIVRNTKRPRHYDSNHVGLVRNGSSATLDALFVTVDAAFEGYGHRRFDVDAITAPQLVGRLTLEGGYTAHVFLHQLLEGELDVSSNGFDIREVLTDADWSAYRRLDAMWWQETSVSYLGEYDPRLHYGFLSAKLEKRPDVRSWLAYRDGTPAAFLSSWPGSNGIGIVEDLYTHPEHRHKGLATALLAHCVADARARGASQVLITSEPNDTPKRMYAALGFRPLCTTRSYVKTNSSS